MRDHGNRCHSLSCDWLASRTPVKASLRRDEDGALTGPVRDTRKRPSYEGTADSASTISPQQGVSTLLETGAFCFALT